jgi:4-hydroxy-tetrahydrodipicolinate reductase
MAQDRALFAEGALVAAEWIYGKPAGSYSMKEVLGL